MARYYVIRQNLDTALDTSNPMHFRVCSAREGSLQFFAVSRYYGPSFWDWKKRGGFSGAGFAAYPHLPELAIVIEGASGPSFISAGPPISPLKPTVRTDSSKLSKWAGTMSESNTQVTPSGREKIRGPLALSGLFNSQRATAESRLSELDTTALHAERIASPTPEYLDSAKVSER